MQARAAGGEYAVGWRDVAIDGDRRHVFVSIADSFPGAEARVEAARVARRAAADGLHHLAYTHQNYGALVRRRRTRQSPQASS